jgi:hypothetical protein
MNNVMRGIDMQDTKQHSVWSSRGYEPEQPGNQESRAKDGSGFL